MAFHIEADQQKPNDTTLTIHRSTQEIGGNVIELEHDGHRLILDVGSPLDPPPGATPAGLVPGTLDLTRPVDAVVVSHPHQDHYGLLSALPDDWLVWSGAPSETLMRLTAAITGGRYAQTFHNYRSFEPFTVGPFTVTPYLTDHSAFDAHMLLVEVGGKRILYSGDFRRTGRKSVLVDRMLADPPTDVDVLLLEGTTLGRTGGFPTEQDIEQDFIRKFRETPGRVFVTWSAQNVDRTVTIYRACLQAGRTLVLDAYAMDVLERLAPFSQGIPRVGWKQLAAVVAKSNNWLYHSEDRLNAPEFLDRLAKSGRASSAAKLETASRDTVVMLRPPLLRDYQRKGVVLTPEDAWVFSMWSGYLERESFAPLREAFAQVGVEPEQIHTSGHASRYDLQGFAAAVAPKQMIPIHGDAWDEHGGGFDNLKRLADGELLILN